LALSSQPPHHHHHRQRMLLLDAGHDTITIALGSQAALQMQNPF
jgi:hypothetical protein